MSVPLNVDLTPEQERSQFDQVASEILRIEQQASYSEDPAWIDELERWARGEPLDPLDDPDYVNWLDLIRSLTARGVTITRVRILAEPPTLTQQYLRWLGPWNIEAGEIIRYIPRPDAIACGLLPGVGTDDWWLFDRTILTTLRFDEGGDFIWARATDDEAAVANALRWWPLALANSALETPVG